LKMGHIIWLAVNTAVNVNTTLLLLSCFVNAAECD
jgi:hypothetical protein